MIIKGNVVSGMGRGKELIKRYLHRIHAVLGYKPISGTINIELDNVFDIKDYETKRMEHILKDGSVYIELRMAPAKIRIKDSKKKATDCWIIRQEKCIHDPNIIEIISKDDLKKTLGLKKGDEVEIEVHKVKGPRYKKIREKIKSKLFKKYRKLK